MCVKMDRCILITVALVSLHVAPTIEFDFTRTSADTR